MSAVASVGILLCAVLLFLVGLIAAGGCVWIWCNALAAYHKQRAHGAAADAEITLARTHQEDDEEHIARRPFVPMTATDEEIRATLLRERQGVADTFVNESGEANVEAWPEGGTYRT